jgi:NADH-quinone oxidoreductase subunit E
MKKNDILHKYPPLMENVLLILHEFQNNNPRHYLSEKDLAMIAKYLNVTYSSIYGIVSYYTLFSLKPRGKHIIRICSSPVCDMAGAKDILTELRRTLKIGFGETSAEGLFTLESTECLGQCDRAPGMSVDEAYYGDLTAKKIQTILQKYCNPKKRTRKKKGQ